MRANTTVSWILIGALCLFVSAPFTAAHAKLIKWVLDDVKWDIYDYTTPDVPPARTPFSSEASGWFFYDARTGEISKWAIDEFTTPPTQYCLDSGFPECNSVSRSRGPGQGTEIFSFLNEITPGATSVLDLVTPTLTDQGGTVLLKLRGSPPDRQTSELSSYRCCYGLEGGPMISGRLIGVEVPEREWYS